MAGSEPLPTVAWTLALASLPDIGPARLRSLIDGREPHVAWREVLAGRADRGPAASTMGDAAAVLARRWAQAASELDVAGLWARHRDFGAGVAGRGDADYPEILAEAPDAPALLVWSGSMDALDGPRTAVVGTRDCTRAGVAFATRLGRELSDAGVRIVSGLALGIDGAAHAGALASGGAPPIAVVGSGLDVVYPRRHTDLWRRVVEEGVVLTEHPLGTEPVGWHFLARNRIIATLADVVVVVESHERGGALQTATQAAMRGRDVLAVPGSVSSPASRGTNALLRDASVCCDAGDVLALLGLVAHGARARARDRRPAPSGAEARVLAAVESEPCATETLMLRTGLTLGEVAGALDGLERNGWITRRGAWCERVPTDGGHP